MVFNRRRGFTLIELVLVVAVIGVLTTVAIPKFMQYQSRARQSEAKANLKSWYTAESTSFQERGRYLEALGETGYSPTRGNRYQYMFSAACTYEIRAGLTPVTSPLDTCITVDQWKFPGMPLAPPPNAGPFTYSGSVPDPGDPAGLAGSCPNCSIRALAAGNIDNEAKGIDTWVIATKDGVLNTAGCGNTDTHAPAGMPFNTFNDVECD